MGNLERVDQILDEGCFLRKVCFYFYFFDDLVDWKPIRTTKMSNKVRLQMFCFSVEQETSTTALMKRECC